MTKSKSTKANPRSALNDILNKAASSKSLAVVNEKKGGKASKIHPEEFLVKRKLVIGGKILNDTEPLTDKLAS